MVLGKQIIQCGWHEQCVERSVHAGEDMLPELGTDTRHGFKSERLALRREWRVQDTDVDRLSALSRL